jgi:hypothetical protein
MKTSVHFLSYPAHFYLEWETFKKNFVKNANTHLMFNNFFFPENHVVYEIMWKKKYFGAR